MIPLADAIHARYGEPEQMAAEARAYIKAKQASGGLLPKVAGLCRRQRHALPGGGLCPACVREGHQRRYRRAKKGKA